MKKPDSHIVVIDPGSVYRSGDSLYMSERSYLGYKAYRDYLRGKYPHVECLVVALEGLASVEHSFVKKLQPFEAADINLVLEGAETYLKKITPGATAHALYKDSTRFLVDLPHQIVYLVEFTPAIRRGIYRATMGGGLWQKVRLDLSLLRKECQDRKFLKRAAALQFNGFPAQKQYSSLASSSIIFFDHRVSSLPVLSSTKFDS